MFLVLTLIMFSVKSRDLITFKDITCPKFWIGDDYCDIFCMLSDCNYDSYFIGNTKYETFLFSDCFSYCPCDKELLTNNICDPKCDNYECGWDLGDCGYCSSGCFESDLKGSECKDECKNIQCLYNYNNCGWCNDGCYYEDLHSDNCKEECKYGRCQYFFPNPCEINLCAEGCTKVMRGDMNCDYECNYQDCYYDSGDCLCSNGCWSTSEECKTNDSYIDLCDNKKCNFKEGKCGYCNSGCYESNLGDGVCQSQCNNLECNYDNGDCGCFPGCSFIYNTTIANFSQIGNSDECSVNCLVPECHFAIDFCGDKDLVKKGVLNYAINQNSSVLINFDRCKCSSEALKEYLDNKENCEEKSECSGKECFFCMGKANAKFSYCVRNSFDECLVCESTMVDGTCHNFLKKCPVGYEMKNELSKLFNNSNWCLMEAVHYSRFNYKEFFVDASISDSGSGTKDDPLKTLYSALISIYASFTKIFIKSQEIDFYKDGSTSIFTLNKDDPLNSNSKHNIQELWIIGNFSESIKTKVYWKENLKLTPLSQKFYIKNIEFDGTYLLKNTCISEFCTYCPYLFVVGGYYFDDRNNLIELNTVTANYSTTCSSYSSVNVLDFTREVYIENVDFRGFRNQYNSFIRSSGSLNLINVNFYKMQAKESGSVILLHCIYNCLEATLNYELGKVIDIGAGFDDTANVATGSFIISSGIGFISISKVEFSYNFLLVNQERAIKAFLLYSKNLIGTISLVDCKFYNNYVNYLLYIDVSELVYTDFRYKAGISLSHSQQHMYLNNIEIAGTYCSEGVLYYLMKKTLHNIKISNFFISESVIGSEGILNIVNQGKIKDLDIKGITKKILINESYEKIHFPPTSLNLETIFIQNSFTGLNCIMVKGHLTVNFKDIIISNIKDGNALNIESIIHSFKNSEPNRYFANIDKSNEVPDLDCNEMIFISNSVNLYLKLISISKIYCLTESTTSGIYIHKISGIIQIDSLKFFDIEASVTSGIALTIGESESININFLHISKISNLHDSILLFYNCNTILMDSVTLTNSSTVYSGSFIVSNIKSFTLENFELENLSGQYSDGACLNLLTGASRSKYKIRYGSFNKCISYNAKGGAIILNSISTKSDTLLIIENVKINDCKATSGSALYISRTVRLTASNIRELDIKGCSCEEGGIINDLHWFGALNFYKLEMSNNEALYAGIFAFYSSDMSSLHISNSKFIDSYSKNQLFFLRSLILGDYVSFKNVTIESIVGPGISLFNMKLKVDGLYMRNSDQPLYLDNYSELNANRLEIEDSMLTSVSLNVGSVLICSNCLFFNNEYTVLEVSDRCYFNLTNTSIFSNAPYNEYLILISSDSEVPSSLTNSNISSNTLNSGHIISLVLSKLIIKDCFFISNKGMTNFIQAIYLLGSVLSVNNSRFQFETFVDYGAFIYATSESRVILDYSYFENSMSRFGNIYGVDSVIKINNCKFIGNKGGDIFVTTSYLSITYTYFENSVLTLPNTGVVVLYMCNYTEIKNSIFINVQSIDNFYQIAYLYDEESKQLEISNSVFTGNMNDIMGIYTKDTTSLSIKKSEFYNFNTKNHSALTVISSINGCNTYIKNSKIFKNRSQSNGGGAYFLNYNVTIENTEIFYNMANESGGGVYYTSPSCKKCGLYIFGNTKIFNNSCTQNGGGIRWEDFKPNIENTDLIFNNTAKYGSNLASLPAKLGFPYFRQLSDLIISTVTNVPPGKKYTEYELLYLYDTYDQIVATESSMLIKLSINETKDTESSVSGSTLFKAQNGIFNITNFILSGKPGSEMNLKLSSDSLKNTVVRNDNGIYSDTVYVHVKFRNCSNGEQIQSTACVDCPSGKYTIEASENCLSCPDGATCIGGDTIIVRNGYWRSTIESDIVYACEVFEACLEGNETNELGECGSGYSGVLCQSCVIGYSKNSNGKCAKCPDQTSNIVILLFLCFLIVFICVILVKTTLTSAFSPKSVYSIYIKIFTNYIQLVFIMTQFNLEWPHYLIKVFRIQKSVATVSEQIFSFDCYLAEKNDNNSANGYYIRLCFIAGIPILIFLISYVFWMGHFFIYQKFSVLKREVYTTIIDLYFLVYPNIVKLLFSNFSCVSIDKMQSYLKENTEIQCWDSTHVKYSLLIAIPAIIIWALGLPTLLLILMTKNKRRLHLSHFRVIFCFLFNGYKLRKYFWEILIIYRKILLITISVFMTSEATILQALNVILVLSFSLYLQYSNKPYNSNELNSMEMQALCIAEFTIYCGLYYLSNRISEELKFILFLFILLGNTYFILYWIYYMINALINMIVKIFPQLKTRLKRGDAFEEDFNNEEIVQEGVFFDALEGKKAYTFFTVEEKKPEKLKFKSMDDAFVAVAKKDIKRVYKKNGWRR